jgi:hypothetical protein
MIPAAEAATVEARLRAPNDRKRGAAATSFMNDRRLFCSSLSGDMVFLSYSGKIEWVKHKAGQVLLRLLTCLTTSIPEGPRYSAERSSFSLADGKRRKAGQNTPGRKLLSGVVFSCEVVKSGLDEIFAGSDCTFGTGPRCGLKLIKKNIHVKRKFS